MVNKNICINVCIIIASVPRAVVKAARTGFWVWYSWAAADVWSLGNIDSPCRVFRLRTPISTKQTQLCTRFKSENSPPTADDG